MVTTYLATIDNTDRSAIDDDYDEVIMIEVITVEVGLIDRTEDRAKG
jgi:hypothetical protein